MEYVEREYKHYRAAKTANILAFVSLGSAFLSTLIFPLILSPISIIFANLSKGKTKSYSMPAKVAFIIAIAALVVNFIIGGFAVYNVFFNEAYRAQVDAVWEEYYGMSFDEYKEAMYNEINALSAPASAEPVTEPIIEAPELSVPLE